MLFLIHFPVCRRGEQSDSFNRTANIQRYSFSQRRQNMRTQNYFPRSIQSLPAIFDFANEFLAGLNVDKTSTFGLQLAIEEVFTNCVKYNHSTADILLVFEKVSDQIVITIEDYDVEGFDMSKPPPVDTEEPLEKRKVGGLGLFLVQKLMDRVDYNYVNRTSTITLVKTIGENICSK
jgi:anti-sigma regulatory factor (Ser/Thr protein kinase)